MKNWKQYQSFTPDIEKSMKQQHLAVRLIGLVGQAYIPEEPDFKHAALSYLQELSALTTKQVLGNFPFCIAVGLKDLKLMVLDESYSPTDEFPLEGKKLTDGLDWIKMKVAELGMDQQLLQTTFEKTDPIKFEGSDSAFTIDLAALKHTARYRHNANLVLQKYATRFEHSSEVLIWPHHFDSATYIPLRFNEDNEEVYSIGLGFAIPDITVDEPYFYINMWSANEPIIITAPEKLKGQGEWVKEGWQGAYLRLSNIIDKDNPEKQWKRINRFFESGIITILNSI